MDRNFMETRSIDPLVDVAYCETEVTHEAVFDEIILLPFVERGVEAGLELRLVPGRVRASVKDERLIESSLIQCATLNPGGISKSPQIELPGIFHENDSVFAAVKVHARNADADRFQKMSDLHVVTILCALLGVVNEDVRIHSGPYPPELPAGAAFLNWFYKNWHGSEWPFVSLRAMMNAAR
jgi:hypothetical protein